MAPPLLRARVTGRIGALALEFELEALPGEIEALEEEQKRLQERMHAPDYYKQPPEALRADRERDAEIARLIDKKLERWESLEKITAGSSSSAP